LVKAMKSMELKELGLFYKCRRKTLRLGGLITLKLISIN